ncbi:sensor histidine kinase [Pedobacter sp. SYP-B3415]|uniref:sensor histidine kinase n=1 Tax=Pedobacter sp. SYP-B3415 TaxID=2496641 RepID=UPI00101C3C0C|nr:histidine kinase [Pedobacter sp. SYP-B3415]
MKVKDINKVEFWVATALYAMAVFFLVSQAGSDSPNLPWRDWYEFKEAGIRFSHFSNFFIPELFRYSLLYFVFLLLHFCVLPALVKRENIALNGVLLAVTYVITGIILGITGTYSKAYLLVRYADIQTGYNHIFFQAFTYATWMIIIIVIYFTLKQLIIHFRAGNQPPFGKDNRMMLEILFGAAFWFIGLLFWIVSGAPLEIIVSWTLIVFATIGVVIYSLYYLIPELAGKMMKFRAYFGRIFLLAVALTIPLGLLATLFGNNRQIILVVICFNLPVQLFISAPFSWYVYRRRNANLAEISSLKSELGKSDASLSFLKSQINPHFLFNALNTLYGTALQENAERTGEGIQKLGDMMRFMLQENMQDKISLTREIDYLLNYIDLQKLRTSASAQVQIIEQIQDQPGALQITPMLLIPFVENAFKHGISLQQPSHIRISLQTKENRLFFDVHNSIHLKADNDPEKLKSGIGLQNVKKRLALMYPNRHELIVRESAKEFFIHLTLEL